MGNRILKESICTSSEIDALSWFEETFFYRLLVTVDDYGIYRADPLLLAHILFPRKESVTRKMAEEALKHLEEQNLIRRYFVDGDPYLYILTWNKHQRLRNSTRKYPGRRKRTRKYRGKQKCPEIRKTRRNRKNRNPQNPNSRNALNRLLFLCP